MRSTAILMAPRCASCCAISNPNYTNALWHSKDHESRTAQQTSTLAQLCCMACNQCIPALAKLLGGVAKLQWHSMLHVHLLAWHVQPSGIRTICVVRHELT